MGIDGIPDFEELRIAESYPLDDALPYVFGKEVRHLVRLDIAADLEFTSGSERRRHQEHKRHCENSRRNPGISFKNDHAVLLEGVRRAWTPASRGSSHIQLCRSQENSATILRSTVNLLTIFA